MVNVSVEIPPAGMDVGEKFLLNCVPTTVSVAVLLAAPAAPACVLLTPPLVLAYAPAAPDVTFTVTWHVELAGTEPPLNATDPPLAAAVNVPPEQLVAPAGLAVLTRLDG